MGQGAYPFVLLLCIWHLHPGVIDIMVLFHIKVWDIIQLYKFGSRSIQDNLKGIFRQIDVNHVELPLLDWYNCRCCTCKQVLRHISRGESSILPHYLWTQPRLVGYQTPICYE